MRSCEFKVSLPSYDFLLRREGFGDSEGRKPCDHRGRDQSDVAISQRILRIMGKLKKSKEARRGFP
jgi:hypothetical protein